MMIDRRIDAISKIMNCAPEVIRKSCFFMDITNIHEYKDSLDKSIWSLDDFPNINLPWKYLWAEYSLKGNKTGLDTNNNRIYTHIGIMGIEKEPNQNQEFYLFV